MSHLVRELTQTSSSYGRLIDSVEAIGSSLAGSGMLTSLAVACVVFGTGMSPNGDGTTTGTANGVADTTFPAGEELPELPVGESMRLTSHAIPRSLERRHGATAGQF